MGYNQADGYFCAFSRRFCDSALSDLGKDESDMSLKKKGIYPADVLTSLRIVGAVVMLFIEPLTIPFYVLYLVCGLSDALDGYVARKTHTARPNGARLDSIADLLFYTVMLSSLIRSGKLAYVPLAAWCIAGAAVALRLVSYSWAFLKFHRFASQHTYGNKFTGFCVFVLPFLLASNNVTFLVITSYIIAVAAFLSSAEELLIHITAKEYLPDRKSLFFYKKK